ncbi:MAG: hypothetical protein ACJ71E_08375 [Nitrososphaeraceae archaeon]
MKCIIIPADDNKNNIDWDEIVKKEARGTNDADFGEVQLTIGDTVITEKGITDKKRFYLPKSLADKFDGHTLWFRITEDEAYNTYRDIEEIL